jgi:hypothetical protein
LQQALSGSESPLTKGWLSSPPGSDRDPHRWKTDQKK